MTTPSTGNARGPEPTGIAIYTDIRQRTFKMIQQPPPKAKPVPLVAIIHADGHIAFFAERGTVDVQVIHCPDAGHSIDADELTERWIETRLRAAHKAVYWPSNIITSGNANRCTTPKRRLATAARLQLCRDLDDIRRKYSGTTSSSKEVGR